LLNNSVLNFDLSLLFFDFPEDVPKESDLHLVCLQIVVTTFIINLFIYLVQEFFNMEK